MAGVGLALGWAWLKLALLWSGRGWRDDAAGLLFYPDHQPAPLHFLQGLTFAFTTGGLALGLSWLWTHLPD